ncbi:uncharacterized protein LOC119173336 isoform X3 [Rhipicephalus microplus]|uniref:uncharacterized protein LOC119173336 isoform X3 n=1 Tax=Rhipicephalus microplus TaxID=6941 RepID=UPI003F6D238A
MKRTALYRVTFLCIALQNLWSGDVPGGKVYASSCENSGKPFTEKLLELHNASIRLAKMRGTSRPVHFAEPCPGFCNENSVRNSCPQGCACRVLNELKPPLYMCFQEGKTPPMGFSYV